MKRLIVTSWFIPILCSCAQTSRQHLGLWEATVPGNDVITWRITDRVIEMTGSEPMSCYYTIDYSKTPIWLDFTRDKENVRCIMEFLSDDSFKITGEEDSDKPRPANFREAKDILRFRRIKK
ncbi:MAG: hypothetical protein JXM79_17430 [Sedimentisphaerales bacterium]|nr:hypothetical protein [Sedimentisphaerales bacterium]